MNQLEKCNKQKHTITEKEWLEIYRNDELIQKYREVGDGENHNKRLKELALKYNYTINQTKKMSEIQQKNHKLK